MAALGEAFDAQERELASLREQVVVWKRFARAADNVIGALRDYNEHKTVETFAVAIERAVEYQVEKKAISQWM